MRGDHIVPRFRLAQWASPKGEIAVFKRDTREITFEDPEKFNRVENFNTMEAPDGSGDRWLEQEFLAGLDSDVARYLGQLEQIQPPRSHMRRVQKEGWHFGHLLAPRHQVRLAMYLGAEMTRNPGWRQAVNLDTAADMKRTVEERVEEDLAQATDPDEIERLKQLLGLRYLVAETPKNLVPHLSGHLAYWIGKVLYERFSWAVHRFEEPVLVLGNDPVVLINDNDRSVGSFSQVARKGNALSIYRPVPQLVEKAIGVVKACTRIMVPIDPRHALVLSRVEHLWPPGRYDQPVELAEIFNLLTMASSRTWMVWLPGAEIRVATKGMATIKVKVPFAP